MSPLVPDLQNQEMLNQTPRMMTLSIRRSHLLQLKDPLEARKANSRIDVGTSVNYNFKSCGANQATLQLQTWERNSGTAAVEWLLAIPEPSVH